MSAFGDIFFLLHNLSHQSKTMLAAGRKITMRQGIGILWHKEVWEAYSQRQLVKMFSARNFQLDEPPYSGVVASMTKSKKEKKSQSSWFSHGDALILSGVLCGSPNIRRQFCHFLQDISFTPQSWLLPRESMQRLKKSHDLKKHQYKVEEVF